MISKEVKRKILICDSISLVVIMSFPINIGIRIGIQDYLGMLVYLSLFLLGLLYVKQEGKIIRNMLEIETLIDYGEPAKGRFGQ